MNKKELKRQYLLKRLEDPKTRDYEKKNIRRKLGLSWTITAADFEATKGLKFHHFFAGYIEEQGQRLDRERKTRGSLLKLPANIKAIFFLKGFTSLFEPDSLEQLCAEMPPSQAEHLRLEKTEALSALVEVGLVEEVRYLEILWQKKRLTESDFQEVQDRYWTGSFRQDLLSRVTDLIVESRNELMALQKRD